MDKSDLQELLAALYLRLNGYFSSGFIAHAPVGNLTEIDILAVRFPNHEEPEREIEPCAHLQPPKDCIDLLIAEVKGGKKNPNFNPNFYQRPKAIEKVLNRMGAFSKNEITDLVPQLSAAAEPGRWRKYHDFPVIPVQRWRAQLRLVLFAPDQKRDAKQVRPTIYGDDMLNFTWQCLHPESPRAGCAVDYNAELWGHQFNSLVAYFKDKGRQAPGEISDVYEALLATPNLALPPGRAGSGVPQPNIVHAA
jgi:hypothetical protein